MRFFFSPLLLVPGSLHLAFFVVTSVSHLPLPHHHGFLRRKSCLILFTLSLPVERENGIEVVDLSGFFLDCRCDWNASRNRFTRLFSDGRPIFFPRVQLSPRNARLRLRGPKGPVFSCFISREEKRPREKRRGQRGRDKVRWMTQIVSPASKIWVESCLGEASAGAKVTGMKCGN